MNKISLSAPYRNRIDYIATATLYCWHLWISKASYWTEIRALYIIRALVSCVLPKRYVYRICRNHVNSRKDRDLLFRDLETGQNIRIAKNMVYQTCSGYLILPVALLSSIACSLIGQDVIFRYKGRIWVIGLGLLSIVLFCIGLFTLTKVFDDSRVYLSYFKKYKKKDTKWLKKWGIYTILLYVGGIASAVIGTLFFIHAF